MLTEWLGVGLLATVFVISAACQVRWPVEDRIRHWDVIGLLPYWNFFAPRPGVLDFHLLYRDEVADEQLTSWIEVRLMQERSWHDALWNPTRRSKKALLDAVAGIKRFVDAAPDGDARLSVPYLLLLTYVSAIPRGYAASKTQFLVMASTPASDAEPETLLMSELHEL